MTAKQILFEPQAVIQRALRKIAAVLRPTLGPHPRTVLVGRLGGATHLFAGSHEILQELEFEDRFESAVALMVRDMGKRIRWTVGDGLATTIVLTESIFSGCVRHLAAGANPIHLQRELSQACEAAVKTLDTGATPVSTPAHIERIAVNAADAQVGRHLGSIAASLGKGSAVLIEESRGIETTHDTVEGFQFDRGFVSNHFVTDSATQECALENPLVLLSEKKLGSVPHLAPILEHAAAQRRSLLIVTTDIDNEVLAALLVNRLKGSLLSCAVKTHSRELLEDLAAITGATIAVENPAVEFLGSAREATIAKEKTTLQGTRPPAELLAQLRRLLGQVELSERDDLQDRILRLTGNVITIKVGGPTETEVKRRKSLYQGALNAVRAAIEEGSVPGGGLAFARASKKLSATTGGRILADALLAPIRAIADNAGYEGRVVARRILELDRPFDATTGRFEGDMIDAKKVLVTALRSAVSLAVVLMTSDAVIAESSKIRVTVPPGIEEIPGIRKNLPF